MRLQNENVLSTSVSGGINAQDAQANGNTFGYFGDHMVTPLPIKKIEV